MADFMCRICGTCCSGDGSAFLYPEDIIRLADYLNISVQEAVDKYTDYIMLEIVEDRGSYFYIPYLILKKRDDNCCIFLKDKLCSIHEAKPEQCRKTPFVSEFFTDNQWREQLRKLCAGVHDLTEYKIDELRKEYEDPSEKREQEYYRNLKENSYNLEKILDVELPAPKIIICEE